MTDWPDLPLLDADGVLDFLSQRQLIEAGAARVEQLSGGVSAVVFRVESPSGSMVVKQARAVLDVPGRWTADPGRSAFEAQALAVMKELTPTMVPGVIAVDAERHVIVMEAAPGDWSPYKALLMSGTGSARTAALVGEALGSWHSLTWGSAEARAAFDRASDLEALRTSPYFVAAAQEAPGFSGLMEAAASILREPGRCLVHGDATPKNVLASPAADRAWLLDPEVAHYGRPELDVAMWCGHLLLKMQGAAAQSAAAGRALAAFVEAYRASDAGPLVESEALSLLTAAVILARVYGLSRIDYLAALDAGAIEDLALREIADSPRLLDLMQEMGEDAA